ncbi:MAG: hypothetical protein H6524_07255 [Actinobacteria bacterium]|nr:hypothetical protein [Actinomycetota bacterium]HRV67709.1 hypothetical protein [Candidatus Nanopelagicales bacterium]MCB9428590.1 hypothetical protein [Actinomycetota bacterium]HPE12942.1 hypothetical protein [Actinomycetota bacterium]HPJ18517.1 hypothetical protein [Actinomycetota bacterium]
MNALLQRLDEMALRLQSDPSALALLALGSVGRDVHRLDEHSDLDFFVITDDKRRLLEDVSWLGSPIEWLHRNTRDGYKALVAGIYHEFAVLTPEELPGIPFAPGRVVWARPAFDVSLLTPAMSPPPSAQWLVDEVLSNLYVGLHRWLRGERLAAMQIVQGEALTNALRIRGGDDPYNSARRAELSNSVEWPELAGGYERTPQAARAIMRLLPTTAAQAMREQVQLLLERSLPACGNSGSTAVHQQVENGQHTSPTGGQDPP